MMQKNILQKKTVEIGISGENKNKKIVEKEKKTNKEENKN